MDRTLQSLTQLIDTLIESYEPWGTVGIFLGVVVISGLWKWYNDSRSDKRVEQLLQEKDKTIQRLAEQERNMRILFLQRMGGLSDEQIDAFVMKNEFDNPVDARKELEQKSVQDVVKKGNTKPKRS
jgi:sensor domain CHASE-containing protein